LQPGLYKLRLWAVCTSSRGVRNQRIAVELLEKAPSDLNLRPMTSAQARRNVPSGFQMRFGSIQRVV
jgi:hypothetical protein